MIKSAEPVLPPALIVSNLLLPSQVSAVVGFANAAAATQGDGRRSSSLKAMEKEGVAFDKDLNKKPPSAACCSIM